MAKEQLKICYISEQKSGVNYHRLEVPFVNLNEDYKDLQITEANGFSHNEPPEQFDIIVFNRLATQDVNYLKRAKENGVKLIMDLDDWIELPLNHLGHDGINTPIIEQRIKENIEIADVIWCASKHLIAELWAYNINLLNNEKLIYIPNAIDFNQPQFIPDPKRMDKYTIGYIAGANHHDDIKLIYQPLAKLLQKSSKHNILVAGYSTNGHSTEYWQYVTKVFTSNMNLPRERFHPIDAEDCYNYAFSYNLCDLILAPLNTDTFSQCKSNLKLLEAGVFSLPVICSNSAPYREFIDAGVVYPSGGDWNGKIKQLIDKPSKGIEMGKRLHEYVKETYNIKKINQLRYQSIINLI